jgi:hypothetical protein
MRGGMVAGRRLPKWVINLPDDPETPLPVYYPYQPTSLDRLVRFVPISEVGPSSC